MTKKKSKGFSWGNRKTDKGTIHSHQSKKPPTLPRLKFLEKELEEEKDIPADKQKDKKEDK